MIGVGIYYPGSVDRRSFMSFGIFNIQAPFSTKHWLSVINDVAFDAVRILFYQLRRCHHRRSGLRFSYSLRQPRCSVAPY
jgi:hypothetical protein